VGLSRFLRFNAVGVAGFAVQLAVVWLLTDVASGFSRTWHTAVITALAVEAAVLHNFLWHERWTWADRPVAGRDRLTRLVRFHLTNGLVSIAGNVAIVAILSSVASGFSRTYGLLGANAIAVLVCSLVNFAAGNRLVFTPIVNRQSTMQFVRPPRAAQSSPMCP
jgi:putative flippase GtrA